MGSAGARSQLGVLNHYKNEAFQTSQNEVWYSLNGSFFYQFSMCGESAEQR